MERKNQEAQRPRRQAPGIRLSRTGDSCMSTWRHENASSGGAGIEHIGLNHATPPLRRSGAVKNHGFATTVPIKGRRLTRTIHKPERMHSHLAHVDACRQRRVAQQPQTGSARSDDPPGHQKAAGLPGSEIGAGDRPGPEAHHPPPPHAFLMRSWPGLRAFVPLGSTTRPAQAGLRCDVTTNDVSPRRNRTTARPHRLCSRGLAPPDALHACAARAQQTRCRRTMTRL
ncbi:hypothetical protein SAMN05428979_2816 [Stappia sp. ES.058]|nr:hypothetical protein SAMN05428979_2816 [Stappia sp. ES.058]